MSGADLNYLSEKTKKVIRAVAAVVFLAAVAGLLYVLYQVKTPGIEVEDGGFIGFLMLNNLIMLAATRPALAALAKYVNGLEQRPENQQQLEQVYPLFLSMLSVPKCFLWGVVGATPFVYYVLFLSGIAGEMVQLKAHLAVFLGISNMVTGMVIRLLFFFILISFRISLLTNLQLWNQTSRGSAFVFKNGIWIASVVALVSTFATLSILFSRFEFSGLPTQIFVAWSLLAAFLSYVTPILPFSVRLAAIKKTALRELETELQREFDSVKSDIHAENATIETDRFEKIHQMRNNVREIRIFPPVGAKGKKTVILVTALALLPELISFVMGL